MKLLRMSASPEVSDRYRAWSSSQEEPTMQALLREEIYYDRGFKYLETGECIDEYDIYRAWWFWTQYTLMASVFVYRYGTLLQRKFLDKISLLNQWYNKVLQQLCFDFYSLPSLKTMFFVPSKATKKKVEDMICDNFSFPMILKNPSENRGKWVFKVDDILWLQQYMEEMIVDKKKSWVFVQEFYLASADYRAIVVGDTVLWVIKRSSADWWFKHNVSQWATAEAVVTIPDSVKNICIQATKLLWLDIGWVDFFRDGVHDPMLIEVNRMPQYGWFEQATWISFLDAVANYIKTL